ncbi:MAG: MarR family transcriptional regulator [Phycisphaerae bacterium]|nr:MarR family transcriptional regulator [Gemmatimonadaceae bacterium]
MSQILRTQPVFRPTVSPEEQAAIRLARLMAVRQHEMDQMLKAFGLTTIQYNALRILNGAGPHGLCGTEMAERLVSQAPDVPRLLDRLTEAGFIVRDRDPENRRFVRARITPEGVQRLVDSAQTVAAMHQRHWQNFSREQLDAFVALLKQLEGQPDTGER